jgi:hypothetical protein
MLYKKILRNGSVILGAMVTPILLGNPTKVENHQKLLNAICTVESNCDDDAVGLVGEIGAYQIRWEYWKDATDFDPTIGGTYQDCKDSEYSRKIVLAYWSRYATITRIGKKVTDEDRARIHNGGPNGYKKDCTKIYWNKINNELH